jgi:hypothetical protein
MCFQQCLEARNAREQSSGDRCRRDDPARQIDIDDRGEKDRSHRQSNGLLAVLTPAASLLSPLALAAAATAVLMTVANWETLSLKDTRAELREIKE